MRIALALLVMSSATARADAKIDWAAGLVTAEGVGIADRHAPSPAVARGTSRRGAEEAARKLLVAKLATLPLAAGGTVGDRMKEVPKSVIDSAYAIAADPDTDGSWRVTMAVPIEAVRLALDKPRALPAAGDTGPAVLIVDGAKAAPAIGYLEGATIFVDQVPAWAKDAPHAVGTLDKGAIAVSGGSPATLYIIVR